MVVVSDVIHGVHLIENCPPGYCCHNNVYIISVTSTSLHTSQPLLNLSVIFTLRSRVLTESVSQVKLSSYSCFPFSVACMYTHLIIGNEDWVYQLNIQRKKVL